MRPLSVRFLALLSALFFALALLPVAPAYASELDNRTTVTYPSASTLTTMTDAGMTIPSGSAHQDASFQSGGLVALTTQYTDRKGLVYIDEPIDLALNDLSFTYNIHAPSAYTPFGNFSQSYGNDYGSTFFLFNLDSNSGFQMQYEHYYGALGIYSSRGASITVTDAIAVEFDNMHSNRWPASSDTNSDWGLPLNTTGSHVAITRPGTQVQHSAVSALSNYYGNGTTNTAHITWTLVEPGASDALTDNTYRLTYYYYQGTSVAAGTPTVTGYVDYTYDQTVANFGGTEVNIGMSGSTGGLMDMNTRVSFPTTYNYTVNYYSLRADGSATIPAGPIPVKGLSSKYGTLPAGPGNVGPLPAAPNGYELVLGDNASRDVTISSTATNVFSYYYRDLPPAILGAENVTVERGSSFDPMAGVSATDGADGVPAQPVSVSGNVSTGSVGTYSLTYSVTDSVGNTTTVTRTVTVQDTIPPAAPTIDPIAETSTTVSGKAEPGSTVTITFPDGSSKTTTAGTDGAWTTTSDNPLMGDQTVTATATDTSGNTGPSGSFTVALEYFTTTITKRWTDAISTTHPAAEILVLQNGTSYQTVTVPAGTISEAGTQHPVDQLPRYAPNATEYVYTVAENPPTGYTASVTGSRADGFVVTNTRILATAILHKTDPDGTGIPGATYELFSAAGTSLGTMTTGPDGKAAFPQLPAGDYYLVETKAPPGYRLATGQEDFSVTASGDVNVTLVDHQIIEEFPATGTLGALPFQIGGAALLLVAALTRWRSQRRSLNDLRAASPVDQPLTTQTKEQ